MFARLKGTVAEVFPGYVIVDVSGVGYKVETHENVLEESEATFYIYTHVREQEIRLFGFLNRESLLLFEELLAISGVGPKVAQALIAEVGPEKIFYAIENEDAAILKCPGVGKKTGERIIVDLKSKLAKLGFLAKEGTQQQIVLDDTKGQVADALEQLGFTKQEVSTALDQIKDTDQLSEQAILKKALNILNRNER